MEVRREFGRKVTRLVNFLQVSRPDTTRSAGDQAAAAVSFLLRQIRMLAMHRDLQLSAKI